MSSVGETLRRERLRSGLDLHQIAQDTKISVRTLELIEADQFDQLPGGVFTRSFVRQYARAVGLDDAEIVRELDQSLVPQPSPLPVPAPEIREISLPRLDLSQRPQTSSSLPSFVMVVVVILLCSGAYTIWQSISRRGPATSSPPAQPSATAAAPATRPADNQTKPAASAPAVANAAAAGSTVPENTAGTVHVALTAAEMTWVRATANGKVVFSGILQPNETRSLDAPDTVTLRICNAGGISITLNGKSLPAVGPKGQVRIVQLSPDGEVQIEPPEKPPAPAQPPAQQTL